LATTIIGFGDGIFSFMDLGESGSFRGHCQIRIWPYFGEFKLPPLNIIKICCGLVKRCLFGYLIDILILCLHSFEKIRRVSCNKLNLVHLYKTFYIKSFCHLSLLCIIGQNKNIWNSESVMVFVSDWQWSIKKIKIVYKFLLSQMTFSQFW
jgi:hypothetical protein